MNKTPISYLKAIVICHGKSEKQICDFIKSNLRIRISVESNKSGSLPIQITSVMKVLEGRKFKSLSAFIKEFCDVEVLIEKRKKRLSPDFKVYIIMDTDDCKENECKNYINKEMFKNHWLYEHIVPLYNMPELETVLTKAKIKFIKKGDERKKEYIRIFPTDSNYIKTDTIQIKDFCDALQKCKSTNMDELVSFCLGLIKK